MVGMMQIGFGASIIEASPLYTNPLPMQQQYDQYGRHDRRDWEQERQRQERIENQRHGQEMIRRPHESRKHWHERQKRENERHQRALESIRHHFHR